MSWRHGDNRPFIPSINVMSLPWPLILFNALAILCPLAMAILSQRAGTRYWRVACYPLGVISAILAILTLTDHVRETRVPGGKLVENWADGRYS
jgi:hypothetical protein